MIGQTISHYRILNKLGAGGMGEVYLAEDERLGRKLAIKILPDRFTQDADRVRRFEQEARAASALNHPHIITIYEIGRIAGEIGNLHFIATEFIEGETLRQRMITRGMSLNEALDIIVQAANALQAAHAAGIAHRDIKPDNIMLRPDGYIKILDFGLAKLTEQSVTADFEGPTKSLFETHPGVVIGTVAYMSPEQARGQRVDGRTDLFSLGIVFYEMITGQRPFNGETTSDVIASLLVGQPMLLSQHLPQIPQELERIVSRMLVKEREGRYQTAQELLNDLKRVKARLDFVTESGATDRQEAQTTLLTASSPFSEDAVTAFDYATNISPQSESQSRYETRVVTGQAMTNGSGAQIQHESGKKRRWLLPVLAAVALALAAGLLVLILILQDSKIDSIAVLPFVNKTSDQESEYLSEGVAEGIINRLSQLNELSVSSRNSVIRYKGKEADARVVGEELGVKAVLLGQIERRGNNLTIKTELVETRNGRQLWGKQFGHKISDLMTLEEEIVSNITERLQFQLASSEKGLLARRGTQNSEAYDLFLKGRYYWNLATPEAMKKADEYFEAAAAKDSAFALAVAGCASYHAAGSEGETPKENMEKAKLVALQALKIDDRIVDAHLTLAQVNLRYDWDFAGAERQFKRAIEIDPKNAVAHQRYAEFLALMGRHKEAAGEIGKARTLDPRSLPINNDLGRLAYYAKDYDHAIDHLRKTLTLDQNFAPAHTGLGEAYEQKGQTQEAILEFMRAQRLLHVDQEKLLALKAAFSASGREAFWREYLAQLTAESGARYVPSSEIAGLYVRLGDHQKAFEALDRAYQEKDGGLVELKVAPVFEPLRPNTRFGEMLRRIGLD